MADFIKQIKAKNASGQEVEYYIDAKKWDGHSFSEITNLVHGVVDTYVIPAQTGTSATSDYKAIVESSAAQVTTTTAKLGALTGTPAASWDKFGIGDIILMGATSDGKVNFDRWISDIDDNGNVKLDVLETQVATHHHTITESKASAVTSVTTTSTATLAKVGTAVTVVTGVSGTPGVMTGISYSGSGSHNINVTTATSTDSGAAGHSHSISGHSHTITPTTLVSENIDVYTTLSTSSFTPHSHGTTSVAGAHKNSGAITYATGVSSVSGTYVVDLKENTANTGGTSNLTTNSNAASNTSSLTVASASTIESAKTSSAGAHTHTVSTTTTENVVKTVTLASKVATGVSKVTNNTTVAATVVTSVSYSSQKVLTGSTITSANFLNTATVDANGVLSFNYAKALTGHTLTSLNVNVLKSVTTDSQSTSAPTITLTTADQGSTSGTVTASGSAESAGGHQHGFNHTHAIPTHTHSINSHTHTYAKISVSSTGTPTVTLSTSSYTPHTHTSVTVVSSTTNSDPITYAYGGTKTTVVRTLKSTSVNTDSKDLTTDTKYYKTTGGITIPTLKATMTSLSTMLSTKSITPAATGEAAVKSVTVSYSQFVTDVTDKTSTNKGGE